MTHIHSVVRQNKLEIPRHKDEVNKREIHEYDGGWTDDSDTMVDPLTPKSTRQVESLVRLSWPLPHVVKKTLHWGSDHCHGTVSRSSFLKLKQKSEVPHRNPRSHVPTQISMSLPPDPNHTPTHHTNTMDEDGIQIVGPPKKPVRCHLYPTCRPAPGTGTGGRDRVLVFPFSSVTMTDETEEEGRDGGPVMRNRVKSVMSHVFWVWWSFSCWNRSVSRGNAQAGHWRSYQWYTRQVSRNCWLDRSSSTSSSPTVTRLA
jgi:hypothetical protein